MFDFDNVTVIIVGLVLVSVLSLVYGEHEVLVMIIGGLLGFLSKDKVTSGVSKTSEVDVEADGED